MAWIAIRLPAAHEKQDKTDIFMHFQCIFMHVHACSLGLERAWPRLVVGLSGLEMSDLQCSPGRVVMEPLARRGAVLGAMPRIARRARRLHGARSALRLVLLHLAQMLRDA